MSDHPPPPAPGDEGLHVGGAQYPSGPPDRWPAWVPPLPAQASVGGTDPGPPPVGSGRRTTGLIAVAVLVVLLVAAGLAARGLGGDGDAGADASIDPTSTSSPSLPQDPVLPSIPGLDPSSPGLDPSALARPLSEVLPEIIDFVEVTRGHRFRTDPEVESLDDDAFVDRFREASEGSEAEIRDQGVALRALGILDPDDDPVAIQDDLGSESVLGFYDPVSEALVVRGAAATPYVQTIIAHELTHALDDQYFDLEQAEVLGEAPDETGFGFLSLVEGSAERVRLAYEDQLSPDEQLAVQSEALSSQLGGLTDPNASSLPPAFGIAVSIPYGNGDQLVDAILAKGDNRGLDAAFRAPPTTSEQVLDPALYASEEAALPIPVPDADPGATVSGSGAFGAVDVRLLGVVADPLGSAVPVDPTSLTSQIRVEPVVGFGGGSYTSWEDGDLACIRFTAVGDTPEGSAAVLELVDSWSAAVGGATSRPAPGGSGGVTVSRCA